jgi:hypothetical protein
MDCSLDHSHANLNVEIEAEGAPDLLRPVVQVGEDVPGEATRLAEALGLSELRKGSAQLPLACFQGRGVLGAFDRDACDFCEAFDDVLLL